MNKSIPGIHHVTAICANAQQNVDFCVGLVGVNPNILRLSLML